MASPYSPASGAEATTSSTASSGHRRRTSRTGGPSLHVPLDGNSRHSRALTASPTTQSPLSSTTFEEEDDSDVRDPHMSLDRSPSRRHDGGWESPGLTAPYDQVNGGRLRSVSPVAGAGPGPGAHNVTWASAKANSEKVNGGYPRYQSRNQGWFSRVRKMSVSLPLFAHGGQEDRFAEKEKLGRGRTAKDDLHMNWRDIPKRFGLLMSRKRKILAACILCVLALLWFFSDGE